MMPSNTLRSRVALVPIFVLTFFCLIHRAAADTDPKYYAVQASAQIQTSPPQVQLVWAADPNATGYTVSRKAPDASNWGPGISLPGNATSYLDSSVVVG